MNQFDEQEVYRIIAEKLDKKSPEISGNLEKTLAELGADSLDIIELQLDFEDNFEMLFDEREFAEKYEKATISNIISYLKQEYGKTARAK